MKRFVVVGAMALALTRMASAQTIWSEDFNYGSTAGDLTAVSAGTWANHSGGTPLVTVKYQATSLSMSGYAFSGLGGAATISTTGNEDVNRSLGADQAGHIYVSALVRVTACGGGAYFLHLSRTGTTTFKPRVWAQNADASTFRFGLSHGNTATYTTGTYSYDTTYLLVLHYNAADGDTDLHVLSSAPSSEPLTPTLSVVDTSPSATLNAVAIRQASGGPSAVIDGIRAGTSWSDLNLPVELMSVDVE